MRCLELFSGTGSVGKLLKKRGHEVISLDLKGADINCDILDWDYKKYKPGHFTYIHSSPPCDTFSTCRKSWFGRRLKAHNMEVFTREQFEQDQLSIGVPILNKTLEIIKYFNPKYWTLENPQSGDMKRWIDKELEYTDIDYCRYGFLYRKRTRIWNNFGFKGLLCNKICGNIVDGKHIQALGRTDTLSMATRYSIPPKLINDWLDHMLEEDLNLKELNI